jgi:hypothetical protein
MANPSGTDFPVVPTLPYIQGRRPMSAEVDLRERQSRGRSSQDIRCTQLNTSLDQFLCVPISLCANFSQPRMPLSSLELFPECSLPTEREIVRRDSSSFQARVSSAARRRRRRAPFEQVRMLSSLLAFLVLLGLRRRGRRRRTWIFFSTSSAPVRLLLLAECIQLQQQL